MVDGSVRDIAIVDDDAALVDMIEFALGSSGYSVSRYATGPDALDALLALPPDAAPCLVLLGVDLPGLDGHTLHEQLQLARPGRFIIAFMSDRGGDADQIRALSAGAVDYLVKPISIPVLLAKVEVWRRGGAAA